MYPVATEGYRAIDQWPGQPERCCKCKIQMILKSLVWKKKHINYCNNFCIDCLLKLSYTEYIDLDKIKENYFYFSIFSLNINI